MCLISSNVFAEYFSSELVELKGKVFFKEGEAGKPDTVILKTEDGDYGVLPSDSLNHLINTENFEFTEYL